jgi:hypothetical protein
MQKLFEVRKQHGSTYATVFPDGTIVPWKPLSIEDFIKYSFDQFRGLIPPVHLEDEIFKKCIIDTTYIRQMSLLKAGIVSTVVSNIWQYSGPTGIDAFNNDLNTARQMLNADGVKAIHQLVEMVTLAFPYKPEEVYQMDYETLLMRVAQAEAKLLQLGTIKEPIQMKDEDKKPQRGPRPSDPNQKFKSRIDAKKLWEEQRGIKQQDQPIPSKDQEKKWWKKSPVLEVPPKHNIDFNTEQKEHDIFALSGHEKADVHIARDKMVKDAQWIYADLIKELAQKNKK